MAEPFMLTDAEKRGYQDGLLALAMCQDLAAHFGLDLDVTRLLLTRHALAGHASTLGGWKMAADLLTRAGMVAGPYQPAVH